MSQDKKYLRQLLSTRYEWFEERIHIRAESKGYGYVSPAMSKMFGQLGSTPISMSEIARRLSISRQAVHKMMNEAHNYGLIEFIENPDDKRVRLVTYSDKGREMAAEARREMARIEQELIERIGERDVLELKRILTQEW